MAVESTNLFIQKALSNLASCYPNWQLSKTTICIPAHHSLTRNYLGPESEKASNHSAHDESHRRGGDAELQFFSAMKSLKNIGGILIANLDQREICKKIPHSLKSRMQTVIDRHGEESCYKNLSAQFECDFLFLHFQIGIYVIEVKATEKVDKEINRSKYQEAKKQIKELLLKIHLLWEAIIGECPNDIPIRAGICFPNCNLPRPDDDSFDHIDKCMLETPAMLRQFWMDMIKKRLNDQTVFSKSEFQLFIGALIGCRSGIFLNEMQNALEIARIIDRQHFNRLPNKNKCRHIKSRRILYPEQGASVIFLTPEQLFIAECTDRRQLITGVPGTGKTLLLLLKALISAKDTDAKGKLFIMSQSAYIPKMKAFFNAHKKEILPSRELNFTAINSEMIEDIDDVFRDEMGTMQTCIDFLKMRAHSTGKTVCVITNAIASANINKIHDTANHFLEDYTKHTLCTVMRGSTNIINYWKAQLPSENFTIGHSIECAAVDVCHFLSVNQVLQNIFDYVQQLIEHQIPASAIAIITHMEYEAEKIRRYLAMKFSGRICSRRASSQTMRSVDPCIVVDQYENVLSYEWPFVIVCSLYCADLKYSFMLVTCSRALGQLKVVELEYLKIQNYIDTLIDRTVTNLLEIKWSCAAVQSAIDALQQIDGRPTEPDEEYDRLQRAYFHRTLTMMRFDFICPNLHNLVPGCHTYTDCLELVAGDSAMLQRFIWKSVRSKSSQDIARTFERFQSKLLISNERGSKFFANALQIDLKIDSKKQKKLWAFAVKWVDETNAFLAKNSYEIILNNNIPAMENDFEQWLWELISSFFDVVIWSQFCF